MAVACTAQSGLDAGAEFAQQGEVGSLAIVQLDRWATPDEPAEQLVAGAKVVRYRGIEADAVARLLGGEVSELERCERVDSLPADEIAPDAEVALLDIGAIELEVGDLATVLAPRTFPAVGSTAAGAFYSVEAALGEARASDPLGDDAEVHLRAQGGEGVGRFELVTPAPEHVSGLSVDGAALDAGVVVRHDRDLELAWDAADPRDRLELELSVGGEVLTCACRDDGHFTVPAGQLSALEPGAPASLIVRRVRLESFEMSGVDQAYARVSSTRGFDLRLR